MSKLKSIDLSKFGLTKDIAKKMTIRAEFLLCFAPHSRRCGLRRGENRLSDSKRSKKLSSSDSLDMKPRLNLEEVIEWGKSFKSLLSSKDGRKVFSEFLKKEFSQENILFYEAVEELTLIQDEDEIFDKTRTIYEDFISTLSPREVSLDSTIRDEIQEKMINPDKEIFKNAKDHIYNLMLRDSYPRFRNSDIYRAALEESRGYI